MIKKILSTTLAFILILGLSIPAYAEETADIDELLAPYQEVINKVNSELGSTIYIPDLNKEKVYNNIKDKVPTEIEKLLRNEYNDFVSGESSAIQPRTGNYTSSSSVENDFNEIVITPQSVREDIKQTVPISYNSEMFLESSVFSGTGELGTYTYQSIYRYGSRWPSSFTGFHFEVTSGSYSLSGDRKKCTVTLKGHPEDANGFALAVLLTETFTFSAN